MTIPIAAQMVTVRHAAERDLAGTLERIAATGYLGIELFGLHGSEPDEFRSLVERFDLTMIGSGVPPADDDRAPQWLSELDAVGCDVLVGELEDKHFASAEAIKKGAELFNRFAAEQVDAGKTVMYHNHWWEFTPDSDGSVPMFEFVEQLDPSISLVIDCYWVVTGGTDLVSALTDLAPRVKRIHLKDGPCNTTDPMVPVGSGKVDFPPAIAAVPQVEWHVTELDEYEGDPLDALELSYRYLVDRGFSHGRSAS